jgi:hypoxanthine phosphoribosyltransferase
VRRVAGEIAAAMRETHPLVLSVMGGAVIFTGQLLPLLAFPLEFDYLHVTRYGDTTTGGELSWIVAPRAPLPAARCWWWTMCSTRASRWPR